MKKKIKKDLGKEIGQGFFEDEESNQRDEIRSFTSVGQKTDRDFFCDEKNIPQTCYEIKYKEKKQEDFWQVLCNKKNMLEIPGSKLTLEQKKYLHSVPGFQFLLFYFKNLKTNFNFSEFQNALSSKI